jgi:hypothetical protein
MPKEDASTSDPAPSLAHPRPVRPALAFVDFIAVALLLAITNYFLAPQDPAWLQLNPTPLLLLPLLLGVRYGFLPGIFAGLAASGFCLAAARFLQPAAPLSDLAQSHRYLLTSLPLAGAVFGQLTDALRKSLHSSQQLASTLDTQNNTLFAERNLFILAKEDLQQRLGLYGASNASLDEKLLALTDAKENEVAPIFVQLLEDIAHVTSAGLYFDTGPGRNRSLTRLATSGDPALFPDYLDPGDDNLLTKALGRNAFVTQDELWKDTPLRGPGYLIAAPMTSRQEPDRRLLLIVQDMPFTELNPHNLCLIQVLCEWFESLVLNRDDPPAPQPFTAVTQEAFYDALQTAARTHTDQAVPSTIVRLPLKQDQHFDDPQAFHKFLSELPLNGILTDVLKRDHRQLLFLFPAVADTRIADAFRQALQTRAHDLGLKHCPVPQFHQTTAGEPAQQLWGRLVGAS